MGYLQDAARANCNLIRDTSENSAPQAEKNMLKLLVAAILNYAWLLTAHSVNKCYNVPLHIFFFFLNLQFIYAAQGDTEIKLWNAQSLGRFGSFSFLEAVYLFCHIL